MNKINFILCSPTPEYVEYIGGVTVIHTLANFLSLLGENVYIYSNSTKPEYNIQCIPWGTEIDFNDENTIVILASGAGEHTYLHNVPNSLLKAKNIVRWLVNNQVKLYDPNNKFYVFHKYWDVLKSQRIDGQLSVIENNHSILRDRGGKRDGVCYLVKGSLDTETDRIIHSKDDFCIDDVLYQQQNKIKFLADVFNEKELFISYTPFSYTSVLAVMCGCKSIIIPKNEYGGVKFNKEKWLNEIWCAKYGIAIGLDDLPRAISTMDQVLPNIKYYEEITQPNQLKQFIEDCYEWLQIKHNI
jgi:hypothetical protein